MLHRRPAKVSLDTIYAAVSARRDMEDSLVWQVPIISLTAQAFLLTIALAPDSFTLPRVLSAALAFAVNLLSAILMFRHREADMVDTHWLESIPHPLPPEMGPHGAAWRARRNATAGGRLRLFKKVPVFAVWLWVLLGFAVVDLGIIAVAIWWPELLGPTPTAG